MLGADFSSDHDPSCGKVKLKKTYRMMKNIKLDMDIFKRSEEVKDRVVINCYNALEKI